MKPGADEYRRWQEDKVKLESVACMICSFCLDGIGGECHTPGCIFWMMDAPETSLRDVVKARIISTARPEGKEK